MTEFNYGLTYFSNYIRNDEVKIKIKKHKEKR